MEVDCDKYIGRNKDLCLGYGLEGRADPTYDSVRRFWENQGILYTDDLRSVNKTVTIRKPLTQSKPVKTVSQIGNRLSMSFKKWFGAVPCGECKAAIIAMNGKTPQEIRDNRQWYIDDIAKRAKTSAPKWWQKVAVVAQDWTTGGIALDLLLGGFIDAACDAEESACCEGSCK